MNRTIVVSKATWARTYSSTKPKTAVVMMNLGGPATLNDVQPFLTRLFSDRDIFKLPFQETMGAWIAKRRTPAVQKLYASIGGGSPIKRWTEAQGAKMVARLDEMSPQTAPHKFYIGFRYASPLMDDAIAEMQKDGVQRAVAFTQYPHYSCTTTGSSLNNLWATLEERGLEKAFKWSIIDRWPLNTLFIDALVARVKATLIKYEAEAVRLGVTTPPVLVFSAHSLPMRTVARGDPYPGEIAATVAAVMARLGSDVPHLLCWQSKVGPLPWLEPKTSLTVERLAKEGRNAIIVPVAFTSDHIETLSEIDIELRELAEANGMKIMMRTESLNDSPLLIEALADIVSQHLQSGQSVANPNAYDFKCPGCIDTTGQYCRTIRNPIDSPSQQQQQQ
eukprot:gene3737-4310_t